MGRLVARGARRQQGWDLCALSSPARVISPHKIVISWMRRVRKGMKGKGGLKVWSKRLAEQKDEAALDE